MSRVTRVVYPILEVSNLAKWHEFADQMYGLPLQKTNNGEYEMLLDETGCRVILREGKANDLVATGWETDDLDGLFGKLEESGAEPKWRDSEFAAARGAGRLFTVIDPAGIELQIFDQSTAAVQLVASSHGLEFVAGEEGFGHMTVIAEDFDKVEAFYLDQLGMGLSDYIDWEIVNGAVLHLGFFHANARHHSFAAGGMPGMPRRLHHFMIQVGDKQQVGMSFDRIRKAGIKVMNEIGVHPNDKSFTFYVKSPSGFEAELGCDGLKVDMNDPDREPGQYYDLSVWGHKMSTLDALPLKAFATVQKWRGAL